LGHAGEERLETYAMTYRGVRVASAIAVLVTLGQFASVSAAPPKPVTSLRELRQANVVMQKWDISCGAAALATVLTYALDHPIAEETIARAMLRQQPTPERIRQRGGFSFLDLKRFADQHGFRARAYRNLTLDHLRKLSSPIVPIRVHGDAHFVVVRGIDDDGVHLADPGFGNRRLSLAKFERAWLGGLGLIVVRA